VIGSRLDQIAAFSVFTILPVMILITSIRTDTVLGLLLLAVLFAWSTERNGAR
jgi:hypothetical protein